MQFLILGLLLGGPLSLYDVHKRFSGGISLFYAASFGSIQRSLKQATVQGWVTLTDDETSRRGKKLYSITDAGRDAWRTWMLSPLTGSDPEPTMLAKIYLLAQLPTADRAECLALIRSRVNEDARELTALESQLDDRTVPQPLRDTFRFQKATLNYGIRSHELARRWLDELEQTLP